VFSGWPEGYACILISIVFWMILMGTVSFIDPDLLSTNVIIFSAGIITAANFAFFYHQRRYRKIEATFDQIHPADHVRAGFVTIAFLVCTFCFYMFGVLSGGTST
jgi:hypothetical protein